MISWARQRTGTGPAAAGAGPPVEDAVATIIRNGFIRAPEPPGIGDVLMAGGR